MATHATRLARVEAGLTPTELVVRWLDEAHAHGSLEAYVTALLDEPPEALPLSRLLRDAEATTRRGARTRNPDPDGLIRKVLLATAFRFELVMRINVATHELLDQDLLRKLALSSIGSLIAGASDADRAREDHRTTLRRALWLADASVTALLASEAARAALETRYLAGHPAVFPEAVTRFAEQLHTTQGQTILLMRVAELDGLDPGEPGSPDAVTARAAHLIADLVEPAKATALEKLGDGRRAGAVATRWLREQAQREAGSTPKASTLFPDRGPGVVAGRG